MATGVSRGGWGLTMRCGSCAADVQVDMKFCGQCGQRVEDAPAAVAERRQLSVMFCDLVGSTHLSGRLDPEDLRDVLREYHDAATRAIRQYDGYVAEYLGDGLVVYFGYPQAHEDDAERAARAGLAIVANMNDVNAVYELRVGTKLSVRVGIHTGLVVVGEVGAHDVRDVVRIVGETPNIAARVQGEAPIDGVAITATTRGLIKGGLLFETLGPREMKGVAEPIELFTVTGETGMLRRVADDASLVDRVEVMMQLAATWDGVRDGGGATVVLSGPAGIGKSKVADALRALAVRDGGAFVEVACSPYHTATPLHPFASHVRSLLPEVAEPVRSLLEPLGLGDDVPVIEALLGLATTRTTLGTSPALLRRESQAAIIRLFTASSEDRALLLVIEDIHWADPSTLELVALVSQTSTERLLVLATARDGVDIGSPGAATIELAPLDPQDAEVLIDQVAGGTLTPDVKARLVERADGVPLFATELVRSLVEADTDGDAGDISVPMRVQDSLMARIDRLGDAKPLAQLAACLGREFRRDVAERLYQPAGATFERAFGSLVASGVVAEKDAPNKTFAFSHALMRDVAYSSLLRATRREHHAHIASVLQEEFADLVTQQPQVVAHHLSEAGAAREAVDWWRRVADEATRRSASAEAAAALRHASEQLASVPAGPERTRLGLAVSAGLGSALSAARGYGDDAAADAYREAQEYARDAPAAPELFPALFGLVAYFTARGQFASALAMGDQLLSSAEAADDDGLRIEAAYSLGMIDLYQGRFERAIDQLERGIRLYDRDAHHHLAFQYVFDPGVGCQRAIGIPLAFLDRREEALGHAEAAVSLATDLDHPFSRASALVFSAIVRQLTDDREGVAAHAVTAREIAAQHGYPFWSLSAAILGAWASDDPQALTTAVETYQSTGTKVLLPYWFTLLADARRRVGDAEGSAAALRSARDIEAATGERCWSALTDRVDAR